MTSKLQKAAISALAALSLGAAVMAAASPSAAASGWHKGYRWHAGYWVRGRGLHGYGWGCGYCGWGAPFAAELIGGVPVAALVAPAYVYGPVYYGGCFWQNRPVYDAWGNFAGYAPVQACY